MQSHNNIFIFVYTEPETVKSSASVSSESATSLLEHSSQLVELLTNMSSVMELLRQAAQSLDEQQRQVEQVATVCEKFCLVLFQVLNLCGVISTYGSSCVPTSVYT